MLASCTFGAFAAGDLVPHDKALLFKEFTEKYRPKYEDEFEEGRRFQIFSENVDRIHASNAENSSFTLGITENADRTFEEWRSSHVSGFDPSFAAAPRLRASFQLPQDYKEPATVDWVARGAVTSVKNQGTCGSCWAFSAAGALEGAMFVAGRPLEELSMQHILACNKGGNGCSGGSMDQAFEWVAANGVTAHEDEPYHCLDRDAIECKDMVCGGCPRRTGENCLWANNCGLNVKGAKCNRHFMVPRYCECPLGTCYSKTVHWKCTNYESPDWVLAPGDVMMHTNVHRSDGALEAALAQQPVSVTIEADQSVFQHYTGGILTHKACGRKLAHSVLAVGYGVDKNRKYWKVKMSWGTSFGEQGYIRIERGFVGEGGECGIRNGALFPTVTKEKTPQPSPEPSTAKPTPKPTAKPTPKPAPKPTTAKPTPKPTTAKPTPEPTTAKPTAKPQGPEKPTPKPTSAPTPAASTITTTRALLSIDPIPAAQTVVV